MKKVLGYILLLPLFGFGLGIVLIPLFIGIRDNDWTSAILIYGSVLLVTITSIGMNLIKDDNEKL